jgi:hypothetical protein
VNIWLSQEVALEEQTAEALALVDTDVLFLENLQAVGVLLRAHFH